jgi:hypothetical protein|tara:strand:- start:24 stop:257 length:234 start_codon:yes stop_codon:yes gene_type:complete
MNKKEKSRGTKYDGKSRVSNDLYRKRFDEIFKKGLVGKDTTLGEVKDFLEEIEKENKELNESYEQSLKNKKERDDTN